MSIGQHGSCFNTPAWKKAVCAVVAVAMIIVPIAWAVTRELMN